MHQSTSTITVRTRVNHTHTLKDGWRLNETTVEVTGELVFGVEDAPLIGETTFSVAPLGNVRGSRSLAIVLDRVFQEIAIAGEVEADRRNAADRIELTDRLTVPGGK